MFSEADWSAVILTIKVAATTTILLLIIGTPLANWLAKTKSPLRGVIATIVALPLVLPPTVIGFYLLIFMGPSGLLGQLSEQIGGFSLVFSFWGLVFASVVYSLPFVVQPIQNGIESIGARPGEIAASLGANRWDRFWHVTLPLTKNSFITAAVLGFAHTVGEFGVVLMVGGNIPDETRVVSVQIYEHVESLNFKNAHALSGVMLLFSFCVLFVVYSGRGKSLLSPVLQRN